MTTITDAAICDLERKQQTIERMLEILDEKLAGLAEQAREGNLDDTEFNNADHIAKIASEMIEEALQRIDMLLGEPL